ncbi:MAG: glycosyltransferase, partial [Oscillospiraceae bacterium]|nr:glycosyltransferase [Oscillospiraceae bacterium]
MKLIIQIPCYNEEETLGLAYADLPRQIEGIDTIEYLIINDGSQDNTVQKAVYYTQLTLPTNIRV